MTQMSSTGLGLGLSAKVLEDLINHVILPPKLPNSEYGKSHGNNLVQSVLDCLRDFDKYSGEDVGSGAIKKCLQTLESFQKYYGQGRLRKEEDLCSELKLHRWESKFDIKMI